MHSHTVHTGVREIAESFAAERSERQQRRALDRADFDRLAQAGFLLTGVPVSEGGLWESAAASTRPICEMVRTLAGGDSSVALVSSMHPAVLAFWLASPRAEGGDQEAWERQRSEVFGAALNGHWWGTITSEPGSGGNIARTRATARDFAYRRGHDQQARADPAAA